MCEIKKDNVPGSAALILIIFKKLSIMNLTVIEAHAEESTQTFSTVLNPNFRTTAKVFEALKKG